MTTLPLIYPDWTVPANIKAFTTTTGGCSKGHFAGFNVAKHVGDSLPHVIQNRARLQADVGDKVKLCWLKQTHSDIIVDLVNYHADIEADAAVTELNNTACLVMTADCLPVLLCNQSGTKVAALHCGWRGLYQQLIAKTLQAHFANDKVIAWLGPAIGAASYEVDKRLYQQFVDLDSNYQSAFDNHREGHYWFDLYALARMQLHHHGVEKARCFGGGFDTFSDSRFFSYRQNPHCGRMVTAIYRTA